MNEQEKTAFEIFLEKYDENAWNGLVKELLPEIHEVDRNATQIWFKFFPLGLFLALKNSDEPEILAKKLLLQGKYDLTEQVDTSHTFLYGHRFWLEVKQAISTRISSFTDINADLKNEIRLLAKSVALGLKQKESVVIGITAVGLMTLRQVGRKNFERTIGKSQLGKKFNKKSPEQVLAERAKDDSQGLLGFLKTVDKQWTVTWDENSNSAKFKLINDEEVASAAARDNSKDWRSQDARCIEGVIPVECRSASCGTCWVGVLGGQEKLSEVSPREKRQMKVFGYHQSEDEKPFIRLACQAKAFGNVTIVIPTWNGVFGKKIYANIERLELEPSTTSAVKLRETITGAVSE